MPSLKIMTFNVENMLARFNFREWEKDRLATLPDIDSDIDRTNLIRTYWNILHDENRVFTALTMKEGDPDIICLQEVENLQVLRLFHDRYLRPYSRRDYRYKVLIESHDRRGIDVAVLSRFSLDSTTTHQDTMGDIHYPTGVRNELVFRRDCLEVHAKKQNKILPIFICHFKSMVGGRQETKPTREAEAQAVKEIIEGRFNNPSQSDWVIVGDLNDYTEIDGTPDNAHALSPLLDNNFSVDLVKRRITNVQNRWTHYYSTDDRYTQLDYILVSPSLYNKNQNVALTIIRKGQPYRAERYSDERWPRVGYSRPKASDHCPVVVTLNY